MVSYLQNHQINYSFWDACVEQSEQRIVYALSWYLDVVSPGWAGYIWEEEEKYRAVMPLPIVQKFGLTYLKQPLFCQQLGIFAANQNLDTGEFLTRVQQQYSLISSYSFNTHNSPLVSLNETQKLSVNWHITHHLDLKPGYAEIYRRYTRDRKLNLKRSQKSGLRIIQSNDIEPLIRIFKEATAFKINGGVAPEAYHKLRKLYAVLAQKGLANLLYTQNSTGETDAGALFLIYGNKIIYLFNAASVAGRRRNGRSLMIDYLVQKFAGQNYIFDFESPAAVPAIIRVYRGFGAQPVPYFTISYNNLPGLIKLVKKVRQFLYQKVISTFRLKSRK